MVRKFTTYEAVVAISEVAKKRSIENVIEESNKLYNLLKKDVEVALAYGDSAITLTGERRIGKSHTLVRLALEYGLPIIAPNNDIGNLLKQQAKEISNNPIEVIVINNRTRMKRDGYKRYNVVLKEELADVDEIRQQLRPISIVGIN